MHGECMACRGLLNFGRNYPEGAQWSQSFFERSQPRSVDSVVIGEEQVHSAWGVVLKTESKSQKSPSGLDQRGVFGVVGATGFEPATT
jgi:hypothetical protein